MFEINGTFFIFIALFLSFIYLFNAIALKPVGQVIEARKRLIEQDLEAAQKSRADAESTLTAYEERLKASRLEGQRIIQETVQTAQAKRNEEMKHINSEGNDRIAKIRAELAEERTKLIAQLVDSEVDLVQSIIKKILGDSAAIAIDRQQVLKALEEAS
jgi:F-type H+-transporting ATPase subunit b